MLEQTPWQRLSLSFVDPDPRRTLKCGDSELHLWRCVRSAPRPISVQEDAGGRV